ncbi:ABC transporter ATP-binding protein [Calidifontibacter sp. DB0510]|uniref:ABC transporter ATP-binding protein n=1 Tax=Metallococcus carri TaxID=1656884 RepID=A0A967AYX3_9MICO|nr:ABC transporter ATP-binding protein [Metallococcus carri]NHN54283.1 ABC transporter ATP-binding protein [Metallococcus carri]NOP36877.1 ABC transporter ATP-binding protein [Calidifontibacter sp. DB2511S]
MTITETRAASAVQPRVRVSGVTKVFRQAGTPVVALDGIDLEVGAGEFVTVLGASGCGKSTLLSLLAGLEQPTSGEIEVAGSRPALMFQESALFPWLTAGANIELALKLAGVPRSERRDGVAELLRLVRLEGAAGRRVHELSGGQRQRIALARSLAQGAEVLLMDEPFAALDAITRDVLHEELAQLWQRTGMSVVFVTHNVREAVRLGERVVLLSSRPGRVLRTWEVGMTQPRSIEDPGVAALSVEITQALREEISRHAAA